MLALRRVYKQIAIVAMRPCCKTGTKGMLRRSTTLIVYVVGYTYQRWASLLKNVTSLSVTPLLQKVTSLSVTPLPRYKK